MTQQSHLADVPSHSPCSPWRYPGLCSYSAIAVLLSCIHSPASLPGHCLPCPGNPSSSKMVAKSLSLCPVPQQCLAAQIPRTCRSMCSLPGIPFPCSLLHLLCFGQRSGAVTWRLCGCGPGYISKSLSHVMPHSSSVRQVGQDHKPHFTQKKMETDVQRLRELAQDHWPQVTKGQELGSHSQDTKPDIPITEE